MERNLTMQDGCWVNVGLYMMMIGIVEKTINFYSSLGDWMRQFRELTGYRQKTKVECDKYDRSCESVTRISMFQVDFIDDALEEKFMSKMEIIH